MTTADRMMIEEGLADYSEQIADELALPLVATIAATIPAWLRQAAREIFEDDGIDWGYEEWKWEREFAQAEREFTEDMTRMDDDGAPVHRDHCAWNWGLE